MADDGDPRIKIAYEESVRGLTLQSSVLDEIRARTGVLLAAASVSSALLGAADLLRHNSFRIVSVLAVLAFAASVALCISVLWPTTGWTFTHDSRRVIAEYIETGQTLDAMRQNLAIKAEEFRDDNQEKLKRQLSAFRWASVSLGVSIILWMIDLN